MPKVFRLVLGCAMFLPWLPTLRAQGLIPPTSAAIDPAVDQLQALAVQASVIFAGEVIAIARPASESAGVVQIRFRVDAALRGCDASGTYILREWAGLWSGNAPRYRVGQRLLMLLIAPPTGGLNTPVGGMDGAIPLIANATPESSATLTDRLALDLRWIEARGQRAATPESTPGPIRPRSASPSTISLTNVMTLLSGTIHAGF